MQPWRSLMETTSTIAIYGQSGHGQVVRQIAQACGYQTIIWIDDNPKTDSLNFENFLKQYPDIPVALGIGSNSARQNIYKRLKDAKVTVTTLVHPSAIITEDCRLGEGTIVMPLAVINTLADIGIGAIINTHCCVEHECLIGNFVHLSPQVGLGGAVSVGALTHIGIGSSVIQCLTIGTNTIVAAGSVVIQNIPSHVMVAGVPAIIKKDIS